MKTGSLIKSACQSEHRQSIERSRRDLIGRTALLFGVPTVSVFLAFLFPLSATSNSSDVPRPFKWRVPRKFEGSVRSSLVFDGTVEEEKSRGWIVVFVGATLLVHLAKSVLRLHDELEGGTVIDTRGEEILIDRNLDLPGNTILIVSEQGTEFRDRDEFPDPADLVSAIKGSK